MNVAPSILVVGGTLVERIARADGPVGRGEAHAGTGHQSIEGCGFALVGALAALGVPSSFISARGGDQAGANVARAVQQLGARDLPCTWLDRQTPTRTTILDRDGALIASVCDERLHDHAGPRLIRRNHVRAIIDASDAVLVDASYGEPLYRQLAGRHPGKSIAAIGVSPEKVARLRPLLSQLAILFASRAEAGALTGLGTNATGPELAQGLARLGIRRAVVTDAVEPTLVFEAGALKLQAGPPFEMAGREALAAIAFLAILEGQPLERAARLGLAAASLHAAGRLGPDCRAACDALARSLQPALDPARR